MGFSLIELLATLAITSLILSLFLMNISNFSLKSTKIIQNIETQDNAVSALLLLKHQIESASTTECAKPTLPAYEILSRDDARILNWDKNPREMLSQDALLVNHLQDTQIFTNHINIPTAFTKNPEQLLVIDDCIHSKIIPESDLINTLPDFKDPVSLSILETRIYFLGRLDDNIGLYVYNHKDRNEIIPDITELDFSGNTVIVNREYRVAF